MILNSSKIIPPTTRLIKFYYYFSYATLIACWILTPFLFYIVITQSKHLKSFQWLIINHLFWCLALETLLGLVKPIFLLPSAGGIQIGIFREVGDFHLTAFFSLICFIFVANCIIGLTATIGTRYMLAFPSPFTDWFNLKITITCMIIFSTVLYIMIVIVFYPFINIDEATIYQWAMEYDPYLEVYFGETSFLVLPQHYVYNYCIFVLILFGFLTFVAGAFLILFLVTASKFKSVTAAKLKFSLIMSSGVQVFVTGIMLVFPMAFLFAFVAFDTPNSATVMCVSVCVIMAHCLVEYFATIYFILPYRKFITKFIREKIFRSPQKVNVVRISAFETKEFTQK